MNRSEMKKQAKERERLEKQQRKEIKKNNTKNRKAVVTYIQGLPDVEKGASFNATYDDENFILEESIGIIKIGRIFKIPVSRLICIEMVDETTIEQKKKSVVARGIAGSILLGPAGMVLGGISGVGTQDKKVKTTVITISYYGDNEQDIKTILLTEKGGMFSMFGLVKSDFDRDVFIKDIQKENKSGEIVL